MKTKVVFLWFFILSFAFLSLECKKKKQILNQDAPQKKEVVKISEEDFVKSLKKLSDKRALKEGESFVVSVDTSKVLTKTLYARILKINWLPIYEYTELDPILKKIPLTVVYLCPQGSHLLVENYKCDYTSNYCPRDKFLVQDPKPVYYVQVGDKEYWINKDGNLWKRR